MDRNSYTGPRLFASSAKVGMAEFAQKRVIQPSPRLHWVRSDKADWSRVESAKIALQH